jgi:hypothetical protein
MSATRINKGNTLDQRLLIDIRNAIEDLVEGAKIAPEDCVRIARELREVNERLDKSDGIANVLLALHTDEELADARAAIEADERQSKPEETPHA